MPLKKVDDRETRYVVEIIGGFVRSRTTYKTEVKARSKLEEIKQGRWLDARLIREERTVLEDHYSGHIR